MQARSWRSGSHTERTQSTISPASWASSSCAQSRARDRYFVVTQWESEEAFQAWANGPAIEAHEGQQTRTRWPPAHRCSSSRSCWTLQRPTPTHGAARVRRRTAGIAAIASLVVALAGQLVAHTPVRAPAEAAYGTHIDTNTPPGLRAKQTVDMLNSDWPIGTVTSGRSPPREASMTSPPRWTDSGGIVRSRSPTSTSERVRRRCTCCTSYGGRPGRRIAHQRRRIGRPLRGHRCSRHSSSLGLTSTRS